MKAFLFASLLFAMGSASGCGGVAIQHVEADAKAKGVVYSLPVPYTQVTQTKYASGKVTVETTMVFLPDATQRYEVQFKSNWFGTSNSMVTLTDGWKLASINDQTTSGAATTIEAVKTAASLAGLPGVAKTTAPPSLVNPPDPVTQIDITYFRIDLATGTPQSTAVGHVRYVPQ